METQKRKNRTEGYGHIYAIKSDKLGKAYFGSTLLNPAYRYSKHLTDFKNFVKNKRRKWCSSYEILIEDDVKFIILKDCGWISKEDLQKEEQITIDENPTLAVNKKKARLSDEERETYMRDYFVKHRDRYRESQAKFHANHPDFKENYYKKEKICCPDCGKVCNKTQIHYHYRTKHDKKWVLRENKDCIITEE